MRAHSKFSVKGVGFERLITLSGTGPMKHDGSGLLGEAARGRQLDVHAF